MVAIDQGEQSASDILFTSVSLSHKGVWQNKVGVTKQIFQSMSFVLYMKIYFTSANIYL